MSMKVDGNRHQGNENNKEWILVEQVNAFLMLLALYNVII